MTRQGFIQATVVAMVGAVLVVTAAASSLGGIDVAGLFAWSAPVSIRVPTVVGYDDFDCNGALEGQSDEHGNTWADHGGNWRCVGSGEVRAQLRLPNAHATVDLGISDHLYLTTLVSSVSSVNGRSGPGLSLFSNGLSHMYVIYERHTGVMTLGKLEVAVPTTLVSVPISDRSSTELRIEVDQPELKVTVDGVPVINYTMTAAELSTFGGYTRFGLAADNDLQSRFAWLRIES